MEKKEQFEKLKKRIVETSLGISRLDKKTRFEFTQLADSEFCSDYGMTLKHLMDLHRQNSLLDLLSAKILELEDRVNEVEGKPKKVSIKTLGGKIIEKEEN